MRNNLIYSLFLGLTLCVSCGKSNEASTSANQAPVDGKILEEVESIDTEEEEPMPTVGMIGDHEYVDLGLPSGTKWATVNMGAETPYEPGDSYQWGAPEPGEYFESDDGRTVGYKKNISGAQQMDAATIEWSESWRLPTIDEIKELILSCTWTIHETHKSQYYYLVTGPNKNSIIIPMTNVKGMWGCQAESGRYAFCLDVHTQSYTDGVRKGRLSAMKQNKLLNIRPVSD